MLLALPAAECVAQADARVRSLSPGARARIELPLPSAERSVGTASEANSAGFLFQPAKSSTSRQVQFSDLKSLEVSTGTKRHWIAGLLIGAVGGAVLGYAVGGPDGRSDLDPRPFVAVAFGVLGGLGGTIAGGLTKTDRWTTVPLH